MRTSGGMRGRRTGDGAGRPRGADVYPESSTRLARRPRRPVLLVVALLALLVPIGLQIHQGVAARAAASQAEADRAAANQALAQAAADQALADQALADQAAAKQAAAKQVQVAAKQAAAKQAAAKQAAADIKKAEAAQPKPGTGGLEPALAQAFSKARTAALAAGLDLRVNSGLRSVAEQQRLYDAAIAKYGSPAKARHWVLPPAESGHVKGLAIDVGPPAAAIWLEKYGVRYGLCRRYVNEWWHFERLAPAIGQRCPVLEPYAGG